MLNKAKKQAKRNKILAAAKTLFNRTHDVNRVSLEAIAAEAGVSPTTIYNNFGDRETLVFEVVKELSRVIIENNRAIVKSGIPFPQKLMAIISSKMAVTEKVDAEIIEKMLSQDKKTASFIDEIYNNDIKPLWTEMIEDGKKQGYIDPSLDITAFTIYLDIMKEGLKSKMGLFKDIKENTVIIQQLTRLMFYGFLKKEIDLFRKEEKQTHD
jgi:AcrR family transcriptional regulator